MKRTSEEKDPSQNTPVAVRLRDTVISLLPGILGLALSRVSTLALNPANGLQSDSDMLTDWTSVVKCLAFVAMLGFILWRSKRNPESDERISVRLGYKLIACEVALIIASGFVDMLVGASSEAYRAVCTIGSILGSSVIFYWLVAARGLGPSKALVYVASARLLSEGVCLVMDLAPALEYLIGLAALAGQLVCIRKLERHPLSEHFSLIGAGKPSDDEDAEPPRVLRYFSGFENEFKDRRFIASCVLCCVMLSAALGLLRGFPDGSPIFFDLTTYLGSNVITVLVYGAALWWAMRKQPLTIIAACWAIVMLLACASLIAFAALPDYRPLGAMFATPFNEILHSCRWYITIALMGLGWRNPYYYAVTAYLVWQLPRAITRTAVAAAAPFASAHPFLIGALTAAILVLSCMVITLRIASLTMQRGASNTPAPAESLMEKILGLDEHATLAEMRERTMRHNAEEIGRTFQLSEREVEVLALFASGHTQKRVAEELFISQSTAHAHIRHIYTKTGFHSRQEILDYIQEHLS